MDLKKLYEKTNGGLGQDHFSFTQLSKTKPIGMWIVDYFVRDQKRRRADKKNFKLGLEETFDWYFQNYLFD